VGQIGDRGLTECLKSNSNEIAKAAAVRRAKGVVAVEIAAANAVSAAAIVENVATVAVAIRPFAIFRVN